MESEWTLQYYSPLTADPTTDCCEPRYDSAITYSKETHIVGHLYVFLCDEPGLQKAMDAYHWRKAEDSAED
ncbi:hypothetical protein ANCDUO_02532 [Ancylostoma duodenale]|uniref:Uncharacterized protein n=1 Tax=Ancylostoma duodenale TaxID=51022 RepID=A0A0C2H6I8_9BILA|nr:hypothetical protein ANCDUO_02532 [Ancylostoma duodenale]